MVRYQETINRGDMAMHASCPHCSKNSGGFIDTGLLIEGEGRLIICINLAKQIAKAAGCISAKESEVLTRAAEEHAFELKGLQEALRDKEQLIAEQAKYLEKYGQKRETS